MIKCLIIDDEKLARDVVSAYLKGQDDVEIVGECSNGFEGVKAIQEMKPDLIFLDVQMPKLTGFEMLELLDEMPVIIFSTAFDEYAIKAFEKSAVDYLLKPYSKQRFEEALNKAKAKLKNQEPSTTAVDTLLEEKRQETEQLERIVVRSGSKIVIIPTSKLDYVEAQDDYVALHSEGKKYLKQITMKYLEQALPAAEFVRVHRSYIVRVSMIDRLEPYTKDSYVAVLKDSSKISVSRSGYSALKEVLDF
ncbi:LytTR family transcriptional regulator DNA-binding domain-containing protein [Fulvivirga maritima]|uniref:LytR/AlgR family response regulator transcription factor n=1 Tax=Fulvivirga maritima TaxID=2904247 RepID=UPI001F2ED6D2|nr:LytTR family transcriptional regulator DNA-binding domain-containing protein [Fulvivirga maritima]UII28459.1 LytTR family transcriptional regulator DNA-binding domain-containing protein [Fulvivirga maritima]